MHIRPGQHGVLALHGRCSGAQHFPFTQVLGLTEPTSQHVSPAAQDPPGKRHPEQKSGKERLSQILLQQSSSPEQAVLLGRHIGVVVEVVLVEVVVVGVVVVVVVCARQLPPEQFKLQHCSFLVQCLPLRLQPIGSASASAPIPSDPSVPPTTAAPINLRALDRVTLPSASPLARSSKKLSPLAIGSLLLLLDGE